MEDTRTEQATKRIRARMTLGASLDKEGEGRVVGER